MAAVPAQQAGVYHTPSTSRTPAAGVSDMRYYLNEGLEGVEHQQYRNTRSFTKAIESRAKEFHSGNLDAGQYLVFASVTKSELADIDRLCEARHKGLRSMYLEGGGALIVKIIPSPVHEMVREGFISALMEQTGRMGLRRALVDMRGTALQGIESRKEANSAFKPRLSRPLYTDWPTLVLECGIPESLKRLRAEARWWLSNSMGEVKTVLLLSTSKTDRKIHVEQWEVSTVTHPLVTRTHQLDILGAVATGAPLRLEFEKVFLRQPGPDEGDIILTATDLGDLAARVWSAAQ